MPLFNIKRYLIMESRTWFLLCPRLWFSSRSCTRSWRISFGGKAQINKQDEKREKAAYNHNRKWNRLISRWRQKKKDPASKHWCITLCITLRRSPLIFVSLIQSNWLEYNSLKIFFIPGLLSRQLVLRLFAPLFSGTKRYFFRRLYPIGLLLYIIKALSSCPRKEFELTASRLGVRRSNQMAS